MLEWPKIINQMRDYSNIKTLGELKRTGYKPKSIKQELRSNLINRLSSGQDVFEGIYGFDDTVIPDIERAVLSGHNILLLGLRGQAKTRLARILVNFLDEYIPCIEGSELNECPFQPITRQSRQLLELKGDETPIVWLHRSERYVEKLATPDVSVADLIGDVDPIKAATLKLPYSDERVLHYGLLPRSHRCIFVINELPDLQARIQVSLFNILQEADIQIRGFKVRLPLDIQFVFTANPEDYTNRGSIITPLKDRIESQILTHYPTTIEIAKKITLQEAHIHEEQKQKVIIPEILHDLLETVVFKARESEYTDVKSGVSSRMSISAYECLVSAAERRSIINNEPKVTARYADFWAVVPAITGKVELIYEGEQLGAYEVAMHFMKEALTEIFLRYFPHPNKIRKGVDKNPYAVIVEWFRAGNAIDLIHDMTEKEFAEELERVAGLSKLMSDFNIPERHRYTMMELTLHALSSFEVITKSIVFNKVKFYDPLFEAMNDLDD